MRKIFPNPRSATPEGIVAIDGNLEISTLLEAYRHGIFPWPQDLPQEKTLMLWFSPDPRGVLDFEDLHIPRSLRKAERQFSNLKFTFNKETKEVIRQCRLQTRPGQKGTWIFPNMERAYQKMAEKGHILSVEAWDQDRLIGGIYGVFIDGFKGKIFCGESMFHLETNASKLCLWRLTEYLKNQGLSWMDTQMVTEVIESMGGKYLDREQFLGRLGV